jgi:hypothetical protein
MRASQVRLKFVTMPVNAVVRGNGLYRITNT